MSAPYFIVLRTAKKPHRGLYPTIADSLPKDHSGKPVGHVPEIKYQVVDLPAWDFRKLVGGPVLRLALGILKKMIEDDGEEFSEAMLQLREISDEEQKIELTKELIQFVDRAFKAHNRRLDEAKMSEALQPILEENMIKSFLDEKYDVGFAEGETKGKAEGETRGRAEAVLTLLRAKFHRVPKGIEKAIRQKTDPHALDSLAAHVVHCDSLKGFEKVLR